MKIHPGWWISLLSLMAFGQAPSELSVKREALLKLRLDRVARQTAIFVVMEKLDAEDGKASVPPGSELWIPLKAKGSQELIWAQGRLWPKGSGESRDFKLVVQPEGSEPGLTDFPRSRVIPLDRARVLSLFKAVQAPGSSLVVLSALVDVPDEVGETAIPSGGGLAVPPLVDDRIELTKAVAVDPSGRPIPGLKLAFEPRDLKVSPLEFGSLNRILLTEDLVKEHFRIRSVDSVRSTDGYYRVVLMATQNLRGSENGPVFGEGSKLIGRLRVKKEGAEKRGWILIDPARVLDPDGQPVIPAPFSGPPLRIPFEALDFWSMDDQLAFSWVHKGELEEILKEKDSEDRFLYSSPVNINLYAGATFSNLFRNPEDKAKGYFFGTKGLLSLEASQTFTFTKAGRLFVRTDLFAMTHPASVVKVEGTPGIANGIREAQGFQAGWAASLGWMLTQHTSVNLGAHYSSRNYRFDPAEEGLAIQDKVATQRRVFLRFNQHDPTWRGSYFEFSPNAQDPLFHDPGVPGNETRRYFRGRAAFRPKAFKATSFYLEGVVNQSKDGRSKLPDETAIYFGFFVDMKNFSFAWPW